MRFSSVVAVCGIQLAMHRDARAVIVPMEALTPMAGIGNEMGGEDRVVSRPKHETGRAAVRSPARSYHLSLSDIIGPAPRLRRVVMRILLLSMPDSSNTLPTIAVRMPNGALCSCRQRRSSP